MVTYFILNKILLEKNIFAINVGLTKIFNMLAFQKLANKVFWREKKFARASVLHQKPSELCAGTRRWSPVRQQPPWRRLLSSSGSVKSSSCWAPQTWSRVWRTLWESSRGGTPRRCCSRCAPRCRCRSTAGRPLAAHSARAPPPPPQLIPLLLTGLWGSCQRTWKRTGCCPPSLCVFTRGRRAPPYRPFRPRWCCWIQSMETSKLWVPQNRDCHTSV